jgi:hypothetical protein
MDRLGHRLPERLHNPRHGGMLRVLDLDPARRGPGPIAEKPLTGKYTIFLFIGRASWRSL